MNGGGESDITHVNISPRLRWPRLYIKRIEAIPMGWTGALPMQRAARNKLNASGFVTYTDNKTSAGKIHPVKAETNASACDGAERLPFAFLL